MKTLNRVLLSVLALGAAMIFVPAPARAQYSTPVRDVENPEKTPFTLRYACNGIGNSSVVCSTPYAVPVGYRFVVETESYYFTALDATFIRPFVTALVSESPIEHVQVSVPLALIGTTANGRPLYANSSPIRIYAEGTPEVSIEATGATIMGNFILLGHLVKK